MIPKTEIKDIPVNGLFLHGNQVWRSLGRRRTNNSLVSAQRISVKEFGFEVVEENADFFEHLKVEPYHGRLPRTIIVKR